MTDRNRLVTRYALQTLIAVALTTALVVCAKAFNLCEADLASPLAVSVVFSLVVEGAEIFIWRWVAEKHNDSLPTFFTAVSGFRMLLAIFTMVGCWAAVGRDAMGPYCVVFMLFYLVVLMHHSLFFARVSSSHSENENPHAKCDK